MSSPSNPPLTPTPFGRSMAQYFSFAPEWRNLNHGSFGTYPKSVQARLRELQDMVEARPDRFLRWDYPALLDESRAAVAELLNVPVKECVFVQNATTGVNLVLRNLVWEKGDAIVLFVLLDLVYLDFLQSVPCCPDHNKTHTVTRFFDPSNSTASTPSTADARRPSNPSSRQTLNSPPSASTTPYHAPTAPSSKTSCKSSRTCATRV